MEWSSARVYANILMTLNKMKKWFSFICSRKAPLYYGEEMSCNLKAVSRQAHLHAHTHTISVEL